MTEVTGQCLCGLVSYRMATAPSRTTICYCKFCQRATGTGHMILPVAPLADLTVTQGQPASYTLCSEGSGKKVHLHFCAKCGTKLYMTYERWPDMVGLYSGTLDDHAVISLDPATTKQIFVSSARPGTVLYASIPAFWQHATTLDGQPEPAFVLDTPMPVDAVKGRQG